MGNNPANIFYYMIYWLIETNILNWELSREVWSHSYFIGRSMYVQCSENQMLIWHLRSQQGGYNVLCFFLDCYQSENYELINHIIKHFFLFRLECVFKWKSSVYFFFNFHLKIRTYMRMNYYIQLTKVHTFINV